MHAHTKQKHKETQIYFLISIKPENTYIKKLRPNFCHTNKCKWAKPNNLKKNVFCSKTKHKQLHMKEKSKWNWKDWA